MYPIPANATRIRYLESTGTQYIDTGVVPGNNEIDFEIDVSNERSSSAYSQAFGCRQTSTAYSTSTYIMFFKNNQCRADIANNGSARELAAAFGAKQTFVWTASTSTLRRIKDGNEGATSTANSKTTCEYSFVLFGGNTAGTITAGAEQKVYKANFWKSGVLVRSFVPVRVGQVGYLFDRVSGQLFGNAGTGDFVLGPDTFSQGVVPTRMMAMGVRKESVAPGIYVEFDNVTSASAGLTNYTDTLRFDLTPTVNAMNWSIWLRDGQTLPNDPSEFSGISICDPNTGGNLVMLWNDTNDFASIAGIDMSSPTVDHPYNVDSGTITITKVSA